MSKGKSYPIVSILKSPVDVRELLRLNSRQCQNLQEPQCPVEFRREAGGAFTVSAEVTRLAMDPP
jgi:hypothetical protein